MRRIPAWKIFPALLLAPGVWAGSAENVPLDGNVVALFADLHATRNKNTPQQRVQKNDGSPWRVPVKAAGEAGAGHAIRRDGDAIRLEAGCLERTIRVSGGRVILESLRVAGTPLIAGEGGEISFRISRAVPNRNPLDLLSAEGVAIHVAAGEEGGTDALEVRAKRGQPARQQTAWTGERSFSGETWEACFELSQAAITRPRPAVQRLVVRARSLKDPVLAGVSVNLVYEIYEGYPVIRKWAEFQNNSPNWIRLSDLVIDKLELRPEFAHKTLLTPSERGAGASVVAFSHADGTRGILSASEVPSALRAIHDDGSSGYNPQHFEWVLGPAEGFVSEPVFQYGFSGEVVRTPSAESLPMDRAVEDGFRRFLKDHLGLSPPHRDIPAPQWATWTNFGPEITDALVREQAGIAARCGFAVFLMDDGWQRDRLGRDPNTARFPDFRGTCDYVRSQGLRLGLWISSFRGPDAEDFRVLPDAAIAPEVRRLSGRAMSFAGPWHGFYAHDLLLVHDLYGASYFKQDFSNIQFGDLAPGHFSRTRKESLLRGLRGLLASQATLRRLAPSVANQISHEIYWGTPGVPCDLAALKHVSQFHIPPNDYSGAGPNKLRVGAGDAWNRLDPANLRDALVKGCLNARRRLYAHRALPLECIEYYAAATVNWKGSLTPEIQDRQVCSWLMGAPSVFAGDLASLGEHHIRRYRMRFDLLERLEKTYGIYRHFQYSGVPEPTDADWHWWGKLDENGNGAVVVMRGTGGADQRAINIPWVRPENRYRVTARFQETELGALTGRQLQDGQLRLTLPPLGQEILELASP